MPLRSFFHVIAAFTVAHENYTSRHRSCLGQKVSLILSCSGGESTIVIQRDRALSSLE
ncbi:hypothetical protein H6F89_13335 [Cyanobacteria bacterium FACHB-63]|nr:hypothetical protein [Cyanobacteria bacterium FACHB-63]